VTTEIEPSVDVAAIVVQICIEAEETLGELYVVVEEKCLTVQTPQRGAPEDVLVVGARSVWMDTSTEETNESFYIIPDHDLGSFSQTLSIYSTTGQRSSLTHLATDSLIVRGRNSITVAETAGQQLCNRPNTFKMCRLDVSD
jgi:hypothetical protein